MKLTFYKYEGTGNDFIIIDNRKFIFDIRNKKLIAHLCHRRFGIGADGLMLFQNKKGYDFEMLYFNADGNESSLCGNGSRCIVAFAKQTGALKNNKVKFLASDGEHEAKIRKNKICLRMNDVKNIEVYPDYYYLNTGSPHYVKFVNRLNNIDVVKEGRAIRYSKKFRKNGVNVNFVQKKGDKIFVRTYERGVEDETLSCGTGATASALVASLLNISTTENYCKILTLGGELLVRFCRKTNDRFTDIWLEGPATFVYKGEIIIPMLNELAIPTILHIGI
jgi:diaminopimelate epimerase